jgi:hypothetical protein
LETGARQQIGLLTDHALAADLLGTLIGIGNDPVPRTSRAGTEPEL